MGFSSTLSNYARRPMNGLSRDDVFDWLSREGAGKLPGHLGFELMSITEGEARLRCPIGEHHMAPNGYLHAGAVTALADTAAGYGCVGNLPEGATGFTTIELKANFLSTLTEGAMVADATMLHGGRTTQVWDVTVRDEATPKVLAEFRCTQLIVYPR